MNYEIRGFDVCIQAIHNDRFISWLFYCFAVIYTARSCARHFTRFDLARQLLQIKDSELNCHFTVAGGVKGNTIWGMGMPGCAENTA